MCDKYADAMVLQLQRNGISGRRLVIEVINPEEKFAIIALRETGEVISHGGIHFGVQVGDTVFDNLFPLGTKANEWFGKFVTNRLHELKRPIEVQRF